AMSAMNVFPGLLVVLGDNTFNLANPKVRFVSVGDKASVVISPDGQQIAFVGADRYAYVANIDGSHQQKLQMGMTPTDWSPDNQHLALIAESGGVAIISLSDLAPKRFAPTGIFASSAKWSPDSRRLAFTGTNARNNVGGDLYVADMAGSADN